MIKWLLVTSVGTVAVASTFIQIGGDKLVSWLTASLTTSLAAVAVLLVYWLPIWRFRRYGVKYFTPLPLFGDMGRVVFRKMQVFENYSRVYKSFPKERFVGMSVFIRPVVLIRDLELAKKIITSDFEYFYDRSLNVDINLEPIFGNSLPIIKGEKWRTLRRTLTPAYTTLKLKQMLPLIIEVGDRIIGRIKKNIRDSGKNYNDVNFDTILSHYSFETNASCSFGLTLDTYDPANSKFYDIIKIFQLRWRQVLVIFGFQVVPNIMKVFKMKIYEQSAEDFVKKFMDRILKERDAQQINGSDITELLMKAKKDMPENDLVSQALFFFILSYEGISAAMSMVVLGLANHPDVQEKLVQEIRKYDIKCGGNIDFSSLDEMPYLDMFLKEALRLWTGINADRVCTKDYNLGRPNDSATEDYIIRKGEAVHISLRSFHMDPQYFTDPERFDPERFSAENRRKVPSFAYSPFGAGPRNCLGARFSILMMKAMVYQILQRIRLSPCEQKTSHMFFAPDSLMLRAQDGCKVRVEIRE